MKMYMQTISSTREITDKLQINTQIKHFKLKIGNRSAELQKQLTEDPSREGSNILVWFGSLNVLQSPWMCCEAQLGTVGEPLYENWHYATLFEIYYFLTFIHTLQSHSVHPSPFAEARLLESFLIASSLSKGSLHGMPSRDSNSGLPYSKPTGLPYSKPRENWEAESPCAPFAYNQYTKQIPLILNFSKTLFSLSWISKTQFSLFSV